MAVHNLEKQYNVDPARIYIGALREAAKLPPSCRSSNPEIFAARFPGRVFVYRGVPLKMTRSAAGHRTKNGRRLSCTIALAN